MILIRTWLVDPRCFKGSWVAGWVLLFQVLHIVLLNFPENAEISKWYFRSHHKFRFGQKGRQNSCYSPFTSSGLVWIKDIVTLTMFRPRLSSFPPALLKSRSHFLHHLSHSHFLHHLSFSSPGYTGLFVSCFSLSLEMWLHKGSHKVWCVHPPVLSPGGF